jgi:2-dehydro-3-deoxygluconokinase
MAPGDIDWDRVFGTDGTRCFHTGGIFAALSDGTAALAAEAIEAAHRHDTIASFDLNYRPSLWLDHGGPAAAQAVNRTLASRVDVLIGNEEDYVAALGFSVEGVDENLLVLDAAAYRAMLERVREAYPNLKLLAVTLRAASTASRNDWGAAVLDDDGYHTPTTRRDLEILDRVGGGDSFVSGLIFGLLSGRTTAEAAECGAATGALAMTTPGDTCMGTRAEVERLVRGGSSRVMR